ncbi:MAG: S8 family serine peptidase, partial [Phycisphaerales bacterium]
MNYTTLARSLSVGLGVLIGAAEVSGQPANRGTDVARLKQIEIERGLHFAQQRAAIIQWAQQHGEAVREVHPDGRITELVSVAGGTPQTRVTDNAAAADSVSTDELWPGGSSGLGLNGAGVTLHEWDGGEVRVSHVELVGAVNWADDTFPGLADHATHVAGTMVGMGVIASARGMAFAASVDAYDWGNDDAEMAAAAAAGARISNHSYGFIRGWYYNGANWYWYGNPAISQTEDFNFGRYDNYTKSWDDIAYNAPYYLICKSAGNERNDNFVGGHYVFTGGSWQWSNQVRGADGGGSGYDCISQQGCAKNILTVGAVNDIGGGYSSPGDVVMSSFSSWGPTDDGRIKPDICANGVGLYSSLAGSNASYASWSGTSMSSPSAAASMGLLVQHYRATHAGADMRAATLKALVLHTADESGTNDGPDYQFGWGMLNTLTAADQITADQTYPEAIQELSIAQGQTITQNYTTNGVDVIRATICWTDPSGTPVAAAVDAPDAMLVNDLDLRVIAPDMTVYQPWVLNPASPSSPATRGDNVRDNVEMVLVETPVSGTWTFQITHKGTLVSGPQDFALIITRGTAVACPPGEIADCNGNCAPAAWIGDGTCDDGINMYGGNLIDFSCGAFSRDGGDCAPPPSIIWRHASNGKNQVWFVDGATKLPESGLLPAYPNPGIKIVGAGDFDGDNDTDILWRNNATGKNLLWLMDGTSLTPVTTVLPTVTNPYWRVVGTDDFDGDGKTDILWRHVAKGKNWVWFMDGA